MQSQFSPQMTVMPEFKDTDILKRPYFKYLRLKYAKGMVNDGNIRIGTLYDFQNIEKYDLARGDEREGVHRFDIHLQSVGLHDHHHPSVKYYLEKLSIKIERSYGVSIKNAMITSQNECIYSLCDKLDWNLAAQFSADSCVVIWDISEFLHRITNSTLDHTDEVFFGPVRYIEDNHDVRELGSISPCFLKSKKFASQSEWRIVIPSAQQPIEPRIIDLGCLSHICSLINENSFAGLGGHAPL